MLNSKQIICFAAILGFLSVTIGAFGAHQLKTYLMENGHLSTFETAVQYQFYHTIVLLAIGILKRYKENNMLQYAALFMIIGIFLFSGSLYVLSFTENTSWGAITPIGGLFFLLGWSYLIIFGIKKAR